MTSGAAEPSGERPRWAVPGWLTRATAWTWRLLVLTAGVIVLLWLLGRLRVVLLPVLVALLLAALTAPLSRWLIARGLPRLLAAWAVLLLTVACVAGVVWLSVVGVGDQLVNDTDWDQVRTEVRTWLRDGPLGLDTDEIDDLEDRASDTVLGGLTTVDSSRVRQATEVIGGTFLAMVLFFFFVKDGPSMWRWVLDRTNHRRRAAVDRGGSAAFAALTGYIRGVAITGLVDAVAIGLALWIIGVPLVIPLAILTFFGAFFPIVGATVVGGLATVVALVVNGTTDAILVAGVTLVIQQVEGDLVMPLVMRERVQLHPAVILVVLALGGAIAGIAGAFVAIPLAAMTVAAVGAASTGEAAGPTASETSPSEA